MTISSMTNECSTVEAISIAWRCDNAIQLAFPNAACPGLHQKPLDITIGQLLTPYCPGGRQGNSKQNNDENVPTLLAISGRGGEPVQYRAHCLMEEVHVFPKSH